MKKLISGSSTANDKKIYDAGRVILFFVACIMFFYLSALEIYKGHDFNPIEFGTGFGLLFASGLALNHKKEPPDKRKD